MAATNAKTKIKSVSPSKHKMFAYLANKLLYIDENRSCERTFTQYCYSELTHTTAKNEFAFYSTLSETLANMINIEIFASPLSARYFRFIFIFCFIWKGELEIMIRNI